MALSVTFFSSADFLVAVTPVLFSEAVFILENSWHAVTPVDRAGSESRLSVWKHYCCGNKEIEIMHFNDSWEILQSEVAKYYKCFEDFDVKITITRKLENSSLNLNIIPV